MRSSRTFHGFVTLRTSNGNLRRISGEHGRSPQRRGAGRQDGVLDPCGDQRLPFAQRHAAVAAAGDLPDSEIQLRAFFRPDRVADVDLPGDRVAPAARRRVVYRPSAETLLARDRHGRHAHRPVVAVRYEGLRRLATRGRPRGHRLGRAAPGIFASGADGGRRAARTCAVVVPSRRQHRLGHRAAARGFHRAAFRPVEHRVVRGRGGPRDRAPDSSRPLVQGAMAWRGCKSTQRAAPASGNYRLAASPGPSSC